MIYKEKLMIIYKTTNLINGKIYIGQDTHNNPNYLGSGVLLHLAIKKYGKENFKKEIIDTGYTQDDLNEKEKHWIFFYQSTNKKIGYNLAIGGRGGGYGMNNPNKEIIKKKISDSLKGKEKTKEHCVNISKAKKGKRIENTEKMSISKRGNKNHMYEQGHKIAGDKNGQYGMSGEKSPNWGKKHKPETIQLMREKAKRGPRTEEERKNMSEGIKKNMKYFIRQLDRKTGVFIEDHLTCMDASKKTGIKYHKVYSNLDENFEFVRVYKQSIN